MNYYFLLEDSKSLFMVLPYWLEYMDFPCTRVADIEDVVSNHYIMQSGFGGTQLITKALFDTIETIIEKTGKIDHLVIILDAEEEDVEDRKIEVMEKIEEFRQEQKCTFDFQIKVIVVNRCFESWLLGNVNLYPDDVPPENSDFFAYYKYYNIKESDPERMVRPVDSIESTTAKYHFHYLCEALRYQKIRYSKKGPQNICTREYFQQIIQRIHTTEHMNSFRELWQYIKEQKTYHISQK